MEAWQAYLDEHQEEFVGEYMDLLRIPSISTEPEHKEDVRRAAQWTADRLKKAGMEQVAIMETGGHPVVYGEWLHAEGQPTVLMYGHFDVQPVDPLDLWDSPPFEPARRDGVVVARAASDMKGNLLLPVIACQALLQTEGALPCNIKFLLEGEEEIGSPSLAGFIREHQDLLACDLAVSADGGVGSVAQPVVGMGNRGLCGLQVNVQTSTTDLHSGKGGGVAPNAAHVLIRMLDTLRDDDGHILVDGFYDEVRHLSEEERAQIAAFPYNEDDLKASLGVTQLVGEPAFTPPERNVARPTLEINGIWSGFQGDGVKTVIPSQAHAKITCRLAPDQEPAPVRRRVIDHLRKVAPAYATVTIEELPGEAYPYLVPADLPALAALQRAVAAVSEGELRQDRAGGTVPVMGMLKRTLGAETLTLGASQDDEKVHAPNEFYRLANFARIQRAYCLFLKDYAG